MIKSDAINFSKIPSSIEGEWNQAAQKHWVDLIELLQNQTKIYNLPKEYFEHLLTYCVILQEIERHNSEVAKIFKKKQITTTDIKKIYKLRRWINGLTELHTLLHIDTAAKNYKSEKKKITSTLAS